MTSTLASAVAGLIVGCPVALIWLSMSARLRRIDFWPSCRRITQTLLGAADEREFRTQYWLLLKLLVQYLGRNLLLTMTAALPVIFYLLLIAPAVGLDSYVEAGSGSVPPANSLVESFWSWMAGPEARFYQGLALTSSAGICLLPKWMK